MTIPDECETKQPSVPPNTPTQRNVAKHFSSLREHIHIEFEKKRQNISNSRDRETNNILALVRGLSDQDDNIPEHPEITFVLKKLVKFAEERRSTPAARARNASMSMPGSITCTRSSGRTS